jgi:hypothetical protein
MDKAGFNKLFRRVTRRIDPREHDRPRMNGGKAGDSPEQCRFSSAVGSKEGYNPSRSNVKCDAAEHLCAAISGREI